MIWTIDEFVDTGIASGTLEKFKNPQTKFERMVNGIFDENTDPIFIDAVAVVKEMIDQGCFENTVYEEEGDDIVIIGICENE